MSDSPWVKYLDTNNHSKDMTRYISQAISELKSTEDDKDLVTKVFNTIYFLEQAIEREALWAAGKVSVALCDDCRKNL